MTTKRKSLILGTVFLTTTLVGLSGCQRAEDVKEVAVTPKVGRAKVLTIGDQTMAGSYRATGSVRALLNATLSSKVLARVISVNVREGDPIRSGQELIAIDSRELQSAVNIADANYKASVVGLGSAQTAAAMEDKTSQARIAQAEFAVQQAQAAVAAAEARRDLAVAGPRTQEVAQSHIAVVQAESSMKLAKTELGRATRLYEAGAIARREVDLAQNRYDVAKGQYDAAVQGENMAREGSRLQEIRAAQEAVSQAKAALKQAQAGVQQANAAAMQVSVRRKDVEVAAAQIKQSQAAAQAARVSLSYGRILAPFEGRVVQRLVDPGSMAGPGTPLLAIEGGGYRFEAVVPERLLRSLTKGDAAEIQIDALPGKTFSGRVVEIVPQGDVASHSFLVKFSLKAQPNLKSGMFGRVALRTGPTEKIVIPRSATWDREGLSYVFAVNQEGIARLRIVTLGEILGDDVEVLSGLGKGDRIVIGDRSEIADGVKVEAR